MQDGKFYIGQINEQKTFSIYIEAINKFVYLNQRHDENNEYLGFVDPGDFGAYELADEFIIYQLYDKRLKLYAASFHIADINITIL